MSLKPSERGRYVMMTAPLTGMYSGDYHFTDGNGNPQWGDFSVNLFQQANPDTDGAGAAVNTFTSSIGSVGMTLGLDKPFNLRLTPTSQNRDSILHFPKTTTSYTPSGGGSSVALPRPAEVKFIADNLVPSSGNYAMNVPSNAGMELVQISNPYMAYLKFDEFIAANPNLQDGYYIWNGNTDDGFIGVLSGPNGRYYVTKPVNWINSGLIPPLQSFIVAKANGTSNVPTVIMSPGFTTTSPSVNYTLRAENVITGGFLRMTMTQGNATASAALAYDLEASASYGLRDLPAADYDALPLALYTINKENKTMLINSSDDFETNELPIGIRASSVGEATLSFDGLADFGHDVILRDKLTGTEKLLTAADNTYRFTLTDKGTVANRFVLNMTYTGKGITTHIPSTPQSPKGEELIARATGGKIIVSGLKPGTMMYVYDMEGRLVYSHRVDDFQSSTFSFQLPQGAYIIVNEEKRGRVMNYEL
jgi:hypothetical protein